MAWLGQAERYGSRDEPLRKTCLSSAAQGLSLFHQLAGNAGKVQTGMRSSEGSCWAGDCRQRCAVNNRRLLRTQPSCLWMSAQVHYSPP